MLRRSGRGAPILAGILGPPWAVSARAATIAAGFAKSIPIGHGRARVPALAAPLARPAPTAIPQMAHQRGSRSRGCPSHQKTKAGGTDVACLPSQPALDFFPASADLLHRLLDRGLRSARLFRLVPDLIILSASDTLPVLAAPAARLLRSFGHCILLEPLATQPRTARFLVKLERVENARRPPARLC